MRNRNFTPFPVLKTERLTLRQLLIVDANEIFALRSDENVNKYLNREPAKSIVDANNFIQGINGNIQRNESIYWAIALNGTAKLIGTICLFDFSGDNSKAEIGYELSPGFQGKGIMQEAISIVIDFGMQHIGLNTLEAYTHSENQRSTRLLEKFNFKRHGDGEGNFILFKLTTND
jgi:[ribosomal protein S5]-alanine N-acetyltransferase